MYKQTLEFWVEAICRRWMIVLQVAAVVFGVVALGSILWPPTYQSAAKILVQSNRGQLLVSPDLQPSLPSPAGQAAQVFEQELNSEVELLTSRYLIEQALINLPQPKNTGLAAFIRNFLGSIWTLPETGYSLLHQAPNPMARQAAALKVANNLSAIVIKRSNVIEVAVRSRDPVWARAFLSQLLTEYLAFHARISQDPQAVKFFETQKKLVADRLKQSETELRAAQLQTGISQVEEQRRALILQLSGAQADYDKTSSRLKAEVERVASLQIELANTPQRRTNEAKVVQNLALTQIKPQLLQLEAERAELLSRYQPSSARIREIDAKLQAARKILTREKQSDVQESTTDVNPTWQSLDSQLANSRTEIDALKAAQQEQGKQVALLRAQLDNIAADGLTIERMQMQVDSDKQAYLSYVRKGEEARAADALNQSQLLNVRVVENATTPLQPLYPRLSLNLIAGLVFALALALVAANWTESQDPKVCSTAWIEADTEVRIVAVLSDRL